MSRFTLTLMSMSLFSLCLHAQQMYDPSYIPVVGEIAFQQGMGPIVFIDEAHNNYHTMDGRYKPFADLLKAHNCSVIPSKDIVTTGQLQKCDIFVIANALAPRNLEDWSLPVDDAFGAGEIVALDNWVREGGSLFLIADHMPMPGAIDRLARRFGVIFSNGFAWYQGKSSRGLLFVKENETLCRHWITETLLDNRAVDSIVTFTGSAFRVEVAHRPLLLFGEDMISLEPVKAWEFPEGTRRVQIEGWRQGAAIEHGKGRVVVFGEAAMFTAQKGGDSSMPVGMQTPAAARNAQLLVNIIRWLAGGS